MKKQEQLENSLGIVPILKKFLSDVAMVSWTSHIHSDDTISYRGSFSNHPRSTGSIHIGLGYDNILKFTVRDLGSNVVFSVHEDSLVWIHECDKKQIHFADPRFFELFISIICLSMSEIKVPEFILKNLINKPKYKTMFKDSRMRFIKRKVKHAMDCEDIQKLLWT